MNTPIIRVVIVGDIEGEVVRKPVNGADVAELRIAGFGIRIAAWRDLAAAVPASGTVIIEGRMKTRHYTKDGQDRTTTEVTVSSIEVLTGAATDDDMPF